MKKLRDVDSVESLIDYLTTKGRNHDYYYHYTSWDSFVNIYEKRSFLLTRGDSLRINDQHESSVKGAAEVWAKTYIGSFAYGSSENMAMWGLYGLPWEDAIRIAIPRAEMVKWLESIALPGGVDVKDCCDIKPKVSLADIVYVEGKRGSTNLSLYCHNESLKTDNIVGLNDVGSASEMTGYIKNYAWHYENEVRIKVELPQAIKGEKICVKIPDSMINAMNITTGPCFERKINDNVFNFLNQQGKITTSGFESLVKYKVLCSLCKYQSFEKKASENNCHTSARECQREQEN